MHLRPFTLALILLAPALAALWVAPAADALYVPPARTDSIAGQVTGYDPPGSPTCQITSLMRDRRMDTFRDFSPTSGSSVDGECWGQFSTPQTIQGAVFAIGCQSSFDATKCATKIKFCPSTATSSNSAGCVVAFTAKGSNNPVYTRATPPVGGWANVKFVIIQPCACASPPTERVYDFDLFSLGDVLSGADLDDNADNLFNVTKAASSSITPTLNRVAGDFLTTCGTDIGYDTTFPACGQANGHRHAATYDAGAVQRTLNPGTYVFYVDAASTSTNPPRITGMSGNIVQSPGAYDTQGDYPYIQDVVVLKETVSATRLQALVMFTLGVEDVVTANVTASTSWGFRYFDVSFAHKTQAHKLGEALWMQLCDCTVDGSGIRNGNAGALGFDFAPIFDVQDLLYKRPEAELFDLSVGDHVAFTPDARFGFATGTAKSFTLTLAANAYYGNAIYLYALEADASSTQVLALLVDGKQAPVIKTIITSGPTASVGQVFLIEKCSPVCYNGAAKTYSLSLSNFKKESKVFLAKWSSLSYGAVHTGNTAQMNAHLYQDGGGLFSAYVTSTGVFLEPAKATFSFWSQNTTTQAKTVLSGAFLTYTHNASGFTSTVQAGPTEWQINVTGLNGAHVLVATADDHHAARKYVDFRPGFTYNVAVTLFSVDYSGSIGSTNLEFESGLETGSAVGLLLEFSCGICNATIPDKVEFNVTRNLHYTLFVGTDRVDPLSGRMTHNIAAPDYWSPEEPDTYTYRFPPRTESRDEHAGAYFAWVMNETGVVLVAKKFFLTRQGEDWAIYDYGLTTDLLREAEIEGYPAARDAFLTEHRASLTEKERLIRTRVHEDIAAISTYGWWFVGFLGILATVRALRR